MAGWTRERIVEAAKKADRKGNGPLSLSDFCRRCKIHDYYIYRLFPEGGWTEIRQLAGIARHPRDKDPLCDEQLLQEFSEHMDRETGSLTRKDDLTMVVIEVSPD